MAEILGIIPARGGSKGIPGKNLALLAGRPLLEYTCAAARASRRLTRIAVSTDSDDIAAAAQRLGVTVIRRPAALAADDTPMLPVLKHAVDTMAADAGCEADVFVLLQPTSPLRRAAHIDAAVDLLSETGADAVVSVVEVPHHFNPVSLMRLENGRLAPCNDGPPITRRQDKPRLFARNGPAVIAARRQVLDRGSLYEGDVRALVMDRRSSVDIDDETDLRLAEFWLAQDAAREETRA